jgi:hypothetical protein
MNFEVDGGYSIWLLNYEHGPEVFWSMCILIFAVNIIAFLQSGYISREKVYLWFNSSSTATPEVEAILEETRRDTESRTRRAVAAVGGNVYNSSNMSPVYRILERSKSPPSSMTGISTPLFSGQASPLHEHLITDKNELTN